MRIQAISHFTGIACLTIPLVLTGMSSVLDTLEAWELHFVFEGSFYIDLWHCMSSF